MWRPSAASLAGMGLGANYLFMAVGLLYTTASACNVVVQIEVMALVVLARVFLNEALPRYLVGGAVLVVAGVAVVSSAGPSS